MGAASSSWFCREQQPFGKLLSADPEKLLNHDGGNKQTRTATQKHHEFLQRHYAASGRAGATAPVPDMLILHRIARGLRKVAGATVSVETGFANGGSTLAILSALGAGSKHLSIDPYQQAPPPKVAYDAAGLRAVAWYLSSQPATDAPGFIHVNETTSLALATMLSRRLCVDLFFLDDGHRFDENMLELYHAHSLLKEGGVVVFHDSHLPSVRAAADFAVTNLGYVVIYKPGMPDAPFNEQHVSLTILIKSSYKIWDRPWDHFVPFGIDTNCGSSKQGRKLKQDPEVAAMPKNVEA